MTNKMFALSVVCLLVAAAFVIVQLPGLASAVFVPGISDDNTPKILKTALARHEEDSELYKERFAGRSIFFTPPLPPRPTAPVVVDTGPAEPVIAPPPPEPTIPVEYGGPAILALLGDQVHVTGPKILKLGQEDSSLGLTVLEFVPPWSVKVRWHKKPGNYAPGTYVVEMFQRDYDDIFSDTEGEESTISGLTQISEQAAVVPARSESSPLVED